MSNEDEFMRVPVLDVHLDNYVRVLPVLTSAISSASFIALDCELSGLGNRRLLNAKTLEERYTGFAEVVRSRSIISLGIACFTLEENQAEKSGWTFQVETFNLVALCQEEYVVEPQSLQFLVKHGFDFYKQYSLGIPYYRGNDKDQKQKTWNLRGLFNQILKAKKPVVLHNGLVDLVFLYHNLYANLPTTPEILAADLSDIFPGGIFDTKYITEFSFRWPASYLEYVFRKSQLLNIKRKKSSFMHVVLRYSECAVMSTLADFWPCGVPGYSEQTPSICDRYANHGFCSADVCKLSHDINFILQRESTTLTHQQKRRRKKLKADPDLESLDFGSNGLSKLEITTAETENESVTFRQGNNISTHRAGQDAFMTGYTFACLVAHHLKAKESHTESTWRQAAEEWRNKVALTGKDYPFLIQKSQFAKQSAQHTEKWAKMNPTRL